MMTQHLVTLKKKIRHLKKYQEALKFVINEDPRYFLKALAKTLIFKLKHRNCNYQYVPWAYAGFFANLRAIVYNIISAEEQGKIPVIVSSKFAFESDSKRFSASRNLYWSANGYNDRYNTWEYYFEPVSNVSVDFDFLAGRDVEKTYCATRFMTDERFYKNYRKYGYRNEHLAKFCGTYDYPSKEYRQYMHSMLKKYVKIRPYILAKVEAFHHQYMRNHSVLGIHIRRTDHEKIEGLPISNETYIELIESYPQFDKIYLATDCDKTLKFMKNYFNQRLLCYEATRSNDDTGIHNLWDNDLSKPLLGEEALIEALLLAKCDFFIHGNSHMNFLVLCHNPALEHININQILAEKQDYPATQKALDYI